MVDSNAKDASGATPASEPLITLAAIVRAHALSGELALKLFNPDSELLNGLREVVLRLPSGEQRPGTVLAVRRNAEGALVRIAGVTTREEAEALRGTLLCVARAALPPLEDGEYYLADLPGLSVRLQDGTVVGHVEDVIEYPTVNALVVLAEGRVREVPDLPRYLLEVRVADGFVVVDHLDELEPVALAPLQGKR